LNRKEFYAVATDPHLAYIERKHAENKTGAVLTTYHGEV
jgi:hypothetical protein